MLKKLPISVRIEPLTTDVKAKQARFPATADDSRVKRQSPTATIPRVGKGDWNRILARRCPS